MLKLLYLPVFFLRADSPEKISLSPYITYLIDSIEVISTENVEAYPFIDGKLMVKMNKNIGTIKIKIFSKDRNIIKDVLFMEPAYKKVRFVYRGSGEKVYLAGSFNGWNSKSLPMIKKGDVFWAEVELPPGRHSYKFVVDGKWTYDENNPLYEDDGFGGKNSVIIVKGSEGFIDDISPEHYRFSKNIKKAYVFDGDRMLKAEEYRIDGSNIYVNGIKDSILKMAVITDDGEVSGPYYVNINPERPYGGIMYFLFIDRFFNGDRKNDRKVMDPDVADIANYMGGDIEGIIQKLEEGYFDSLGVTVIWISPFFKGPDRAYRDVLPPHKKFTDYHGYWPVDLKSVDSRFGSMEEVKDLLNECHKRGIMVFFDMVFNHVHEDAEVYKKHKDWFTPLVLPGGEKNIRKFDSHPFTTWFDDFLPAFDFSKDSVIDYLTDVALFWTKKTGVDGFRLDAVKHIPHTFWKALRLKTEGIRHIYMIGETISSREKILEWISPSELDGQFDFPLFWVLRDAIAGKANMDRLMAEIIRSQEAFTSGIWVPFIGNHDFERIITYIRNSGKDVESSYKLMEMGFAILLTLQGLPMIYYGDEIGLEGGKDPDNRRMMKFHLNNNEKKLLERVRELAKMRKNYVSLRYGRVIPIKGDRDWMVYMKKYFNEKVLCGFNRGLKPLDLKVKDPFTGKEIKLKIPAMGYTLKVL